MVRPSFWDEIFFEASFDDKRWIATRADWKKLSTGQERYLGGFLFLLGPSLQLLRQIAFPSIVVLTFLLGNAVYYSCASFYTSLPILDTSGGGASIASFGMFTIGIFLSVKFRIVVLSRRDANIEFSVVCRGLLHIIKILHMLPVDADSQRNMHKWCRLYPYALISDLTGVFTNELLRHLDDLDHDVAQEAMSSEEFRVCIMYEIYNAYPNLRKVSTASYTPVQVEFSKSAIKRLERVNEAAEVLVARQRLPFPGLINNTLRGFTILWLVACSFVIFGTQYKNFTTTKGHSILELLLHIWLLTTIMFAYNCAILVILQLLV